MRSTGIVRKTDELGRLVLPKELRDSMGIDEGTSMEVYTEEDLIIIKKYEPGCVFCGSLDKLRDIKGKHVCQACADEAKQIFSR